MKKFKLLNTFMLFASNYRCYFDLKRVAIRVMNELDVKNGCLIDDVAFDDFNNTLISDKRRDQIWARCMNEKPLSCSMLVDYLAYVGGRLLNELDKKNDAWRFDKNNKIVQKQATFVIDVKVYNKLVAVSKEQDRSMASLVEEAVNYYIDSSDCEIGTGRRRSFDSSESFTYCTRLHVDCVDRIREYSSGYMKSQSEFVEDAIRSYLS